MWEVLGTLIVTSLACGILGPFLVLRKLSMTADALSHSVLLGIVIAFMITKDLDSVWLVFFAAGFGLLTVGCVEYLTSKNVVKRDDALGVVFPVFFSIAVILITRYFRNVHLDVDVVLMGNPLFSSFLQMFGFPKSMIKMLLIFLINLFYIYLHYTDLKIASFDPEFAKIVGVPMKRRGYEFMALVSITCILAFDTVGGILVISFFIASSAISCIFTKDIRVTMLLSLLLGAVNSWLGYSMSMKYNVSISGMCAVTGMLLVLVAVLVNRHGAIYQWVHYLLHKEKIQEELILVHIFRHKEDPVELGLDEIHHHLNWRNQTARGRIQKLIEKKLVIKNEQKNIYALTESGRQYVEVLLKK